jgi:hypothetical protein
MFTQSVHIQTSTVIPSEFDPVMGELKLKSTGEHRYVIPITDEPKLSFVETYKQQASMKIYDSIGRETTCYQDTMRRELPVDSPHSISCVAFILIVTFRHQVPYIYPSPPPGTPKNENMFIFIRTS